jgi:hypothetical protein
VRLWDCQTGQVAEASLNCILPGTPSVFCMTIFMPLFFYVVCDDSVPVSSKWGVRLAA